MPPSETTATKFGIDISVSEDTNEDNNLDKWDVSTTKDSGNEVLIDDTVLANNGRDSRMYELDSPKEVTSENMWERTEVLAGKDRFPRGFTASL